jgi:NAD(P)-dependent dehydrogenase (short-subunit alcohol dehydrogenase family)
MSNRLEHKIAVITGAAGGIGRGIAAMMAREGAAVVIGDVKDAQGEATAAALREAGGRAVFQHCDVTSEDDCAALMQRAAAEFGGLTTLVNNVGWFPRATLEETSVELWNQVMNVNLRSAFLCAKHAVPLLKRAGGGSVISIGSPNSIQAIPTLVAYGAAKGALINLTTTLANAYSPDRIRFNVVSPGWVLTETEIETQKKEGRSPEDMERIGKTLRLGRYQTPEDTAYACVYLASDESSQVTGMFFSVDAGATTLIRHSA